MRLPRILTFSLALAATWSAHGFELKLPTDFKPVEPTFSYEGKNFARSSDGRFWSGSGNVFPDDYFYPEDDAHLINALDMLAASIADLDIQSQFFDGYLSGIANEIDVHELAINGIIRSLSELENQKCSDDCSCISTAREYTSKCFDELSQEIADERAARADADASKASITELAEERSARESKDQELYSTILAYHNGEATENISNILAKVAFTGSYDDLDGKPDVGGAFVNEVEVNDGGGDGPTTVVFSFGNVAGSTNGVPESQTVEIPECKWLEDKEAVEDRLDSMEDRLDDHDSTLSDHEGRISELEEKAHDPCNCGGGGGDGDNYYHGGCNCDLSNYVTFDDLENGEGGCDCDMDGIESRLSSLESQVSTLRTELIRLLNYVGYQDHRNGPGR